MACIYEKMEWILNSWWYLCQYFYPVSLFLSLSPTLSLTLSPSLSLSIYLSIYLSISLSFSLSLSISLSLSLFLSHSRSLNLLSSAFSSLIFFNLSCFFYVPCAITFLCACPTPIIQWFFSSISISYLLTKYLYFTLFFYSDLIV